MKAAWWWMGALLLAGCPPVAGDDDDDSAASDDDDGDDDDSTPTGPAPSEPVALSDGACPDWTDLGALQSFSSGGQARSVIVDLPQDPEGAPVLFFWHMLGGDAAYIWQQFPGVRQLAQDYGFIVLVPDARQAQYNEWDWTDGADAVLFDDLRTCALQELGADPYRVYTTGFSAGGLWSTWLTMHRADAIASSFIMSGGIVPDLPLYPLVWSEPSWTTPVLTADGGPGDYWGVGGFVEIFFDQATMAFVEAMRDFGAYAVHCNHASGQHTPPPNAMQFGARWLLDHTYGLPSPYQMDGLDGLPAYCTDQPE